MKLVKNTNSSVFTDNRTWVSFERKTKVEGVSRVPGCKLLSYGVRYLLDTSFAVGISVIIASPRSI